MGTITPASVAPNTRAKYNWSDNVRFLVNADRWALDIKKDVAEGEDTQVLKRNLKFLYKKGVELAASMQIREPIEKESCLPVLVTLEKLAANDRTQVNFAFHRTLCKTTRIFVEVVWFREGKEWNDHKKRMQIKEKTENEFYTVAEDLVKRLQPIPDEIRTRFEYQCAMEGAKLLRDHSFCEVAKVIAEGLPGLLDTGISAGLTHGATAPISLVQLFSLVQQVSEKITKTRVKRWYADAWGMRWAATKIRNFEHYLKVMSLSNVVLGDKGKYRIVLAITLRELVKNKNVEERARNAAFITLISLLKLPTTFFARLLTKASSNKAKNLDSYYKARILVTRFLAAFLNRKKYTDPLYVEFRQQIKNALQSYKERSIYKDEQAQVNRILKESEAEESSASQEQSNLRSDTVIPSPRMTKHELEERQGLRGAALYEEEKEVSRASFDRSNRIDAQIEKSKQKAREAFRVRNALEEMSKAEIDYVDQMLKRYSTD